MVYSSLLCIDSYQLSVQWNGTNTIEHACLPVFHEKMMRLRRQKRKRKIFKSAAECLCKREKRGNEREKGSKTIVCCLWFDGWGAILKIQNSNCQLETVLVFQTYKLSFFVFLRPKIPHMNSKIRLRWTCIILIPKTKEQDYSQLQTVTPRCKQLHAEPGYW